MSAEAYGSQTEGDPQEAADSGELPFDANFWKGAIGASVANRKELSTSWKESVNYRVQKPFGGDGTSDSSQDRVAVPEDWARSKQKTSQLMFQLPKIIATAKRPEFAQAQGSVTAIVNDKLKREVQAAYMIDECLADAINAAGLMISVIGVDVRTQQTAMPVPPPAAAPMVQDPVTMEMVPGEALPPAPPEMIDEVVYRKFYWKRVSPGAFLWPAEFTGSNWDDAPWLGYESWVPLEQAKKTYQLGDDYKCDSAKPLLLSDEVLNEHSKKSTTNYVCVRTVWYKAALYDATVVHPEALRRIVFVEGRDEPVEHEDTDWQKWVPATPAIPAIPGPPGPDGQPSQGQPGQPGQMAHYLGLTRFPIRVGTLTYVSDMAVPPSDSEAGRPQVREMIRSRSQMLRQRDHSIPIRWYDVNRLDTTIADRMRAGTWQDMIPVNGPGDRVIGEVSRAQFPRENFEFQNVIGGDLDRAWSLSNNQLSSLNGTERSATEVNAVRAAGDVRLDYEKARVNRYIADGAAVLFSLMQLFMENVDYAPIVNDQGIEQLTEVTRAGVAGDFGLDFLADTSDRVDIATKQTNALKMFNLLGNSPTTNRASLEKEIFELHGMDPAKMMQKPAEPAADKPNISFRFSGEDMLNPMAVALLNKAGYNLGADEIKAAAMMIADATKQLRDSMTAIAAPMPGAPGAGPVPGGAPPVEGQPPVEPPSMPEPILKRAADGTHLT